MNEKTKEFYQLGIIKDFGKNLLASHEFINKDTLEECKSLMFLKLREELLDPKYDSGDYILEISSDTEIRIYNKNENGYPVLSLTITKLYKDQDIVDLSKQIEENFKNL